MSPVLKVFPKSRTDHEAMFRINGDIAAIEQLVDVTPEQDPVANLVVTASAIRLDMSGI